MTTPKDARAGIPGQARKDALLEAGPGATAELSDTDLDQVVGGASGKGKLPVHSGNPPPPPPPVPPVKLV
jgi:hypothetical protein